MQELIEKKLTGVILGIKNKTKTFTDAQVWMERLKKVNPLIAEDYDKKLQAALVLVKK